MIEHDTLGSALKAERERRGISLEQIAESTKIGAPLLEALERNDLTRWPHGIYRRAFFRAYVVALGLPPEPYVHEFLHAYGEAPKPAEPEALTLTLAEPPTRSPQALRARALDAAIEMAVVVSTGVSIAAVIGASTAVAAGAAALVYYPVMTVYSGRSITGSRTWARLLDAARHEWTKLAGGVPAQAGSRRIQGLAADDGGG